MWEDEGEEGGEHEEHEDATPTSPGRPPPLSWCALSAASTAFSSGSACVPTKANRVRTI